GKDAASKGFNVGGGAQLSSQSETSSSQAGTQVKAGGQLTVASGAMGKDAISLQGSQLSGQAVKLDAENGGISLQSAQNASQKNDWSANANLGGGNTAKTAKENGEAKADGVSNTYQVGGGFGVKVDQQDKLANANATVSGGQVDIHADGQLSLSGANIHGDKVGGSVGGNVVAESRQDRDNSTSVNVGLKVDRSNGKNPSLVDQAAAAAGPLSGQVKDKVAGAVNKAADKVEDAYNSAAFANGKDSTNPVSFTKDAEGGSVKLPEQPISGEAKSGVVDGALRKGGQTLKDKLLNPQDKGTQVSGVIDVSVKRDDGVGSVSGIRGDGGVDLAVGGKVQLNGGQVSSGGQVSLGDAKVETSNIQTSSYTGAGGVKLDGTPAAIVQQAVKDVTSGKAPLIHVEHGSQSQTVAGEVKSGS
ncbi:hemagglutinin repeat-containing protein, partial [Chromobacterium phragmitis]